MSNSQNGNPKDKRQKAGEEYVSMIDDNASIHSAPYSARHIGGAREKELEVTEGKDRGSWQIKEKSEN